MKVDRHICLASADNDDGRSARTAAAAAATTAAGLRAAGAARLYRCIDGRWFSDQPVPVAPCGITKTGDYEKPQQPSPQRRLLHIRYRFLIECIRRGCVHI